MSSSLLTSGDMRWSWRLESGLSVLLLLLDGEEGQEAARRMAERARTAMAAAAAAPMRSVRLCSGVIDIAVNMVCVLWTIFVGRPTRVRTS